MTQVIDRYFPKTEFPGHLQNNLYFELKHQLLFTCFVLLLLSLQCSGFKIQSNSEGIKTVAHLKWYFPFPHLNGQRSTQRELLKICRPSKMSVTTVKPFCSSLCHVYVPHSSITLPSGELLWQQNTTVGSTACCLQVSLELLLNGIVTFQSVCFSVKPGYATKC